MTDFQGWAFTANEDEQSNKNLNRYKELEAMGLKFHSTDKVKYEPKNHAYGRNYGKGRILDKSLLPKLTDHDIAIMADSGNLCFGGSGTLNKQTGEFSYSYFTD